jgi:hypothetical protein
MRTRMDVEQLKTEYLKFGGSETDLQDISDEDTLTMLRDTQKVIFEMTKEEEEGQAKLTDVEKLETLKSVPAPSDIHSDEFREYENKLLSQENEIRKKLNMPLKPLSILDKDLLQLLALDSYNLGHNCRDFLKGFEGNKALQQDLKARLTSMSDTIQREAQEREQYFEFLDYASSAFERCKRVPQRWIVSDKDSQIKPNPDFTKWKQEVLSLKGKLDTKKKIADSHEKYLGIKKDLRTSVFKLSDKVNQLIEANGLEG